MSQTRAILFAIGAFTLWVLVDTAIKLAAEGGLSPYEVAEGLGLVVMAAMLLKTRHEGVRALWPKNIRNQMAFALLSLGINLLNVVALKHLPLIMFYVAVFTAPMIIALMAAFFLRERLTAGKAVAIVAGFAGVIIAINPTGAAMQGDGTGYAAATGAVLCFSGTIVMLRRMTQSEKPESMVFFSALVQVAACTLLMLGALHPLTWRLALILLVGGALNSIANMWNMIATKHAAASTVAQFHYTQIIAGALVGYLVWNEVMTAHTLIGSAIIIASGLYIAAHARREENLAASERPGNPPL